MTCPPCTHDCREGRDCPLIAINAQVVGYVEPQRTWVGLTEEEMKKTWYEMQNIMGWYSFQEIARAIEARLKDRNK